ncbi:hypothetical protein [Schaalia cardiffensis]|uniref:Uncharacterized protein n=2 Tax=Schaalia TaxID=2529408 RepID=N6XAL0_9ACTO|nr:hypothetical protein [Schaalia cardiffensis]ENO18178.1 hypothetical protein HMPREF9004_1039 [Schaalia cardiffensis F0333]
MSRPYGAEDERKKAFALWDKKKRLCKMLPALLSAICNLLIASLAYYTDVPYREWLIPPFGLLSLVGLWLQEKQKKKAQDSLETRDKIRRDAERSYGTIEETMRAFSLFLLKVLELDKNSTVRISLYCHDDERGQFLQISRVSFNPELAKSGRSNYSDQEGLIATCWQHSSKVVTGWPEDVDEWVAIAVQSGLKEDVAKRVAMKARSAVYVRVDYGSKPIGMVVIESLEQQGVSNSTIQALREHPVFEILKEVFYWTRDTYLVRRSGL